MLCRFRLIRFSGKDGGSAGYQLGSDVPSFDSLIRGTQKSRLVVQQAQCRYTPSPVDTTLPSEHLARIFRSRQSARVSWTSRRHSWPAARVFGPRATFRAKHGITENVV